MDRAVCQHQYYRPSTVTTVAVAGHHTTWASHVPRWTIQTLTSPDRGIYG